LRCTVSSFRGSEPSIAAAGSAGSLSDSLLAWYFVIVWGSGYLATKLGLRYAAPFTFLTLRFAFGVACMLVLVVLLRPRWPSDKREFGHIVVAGALMHVGNLGGSHYAQYLGMSAGITALILATQPLLTALIGSVFTAYERLQTRQWIGIAIGLIGVALVVWHKIDVDAASTGSLVAVSIGLLSITIGTLYQRRYCRHADLRSAGLIQFATAVVLFAPLAIGVEGFVVAWDWRLFAAIVFLVVFASILAVNALHTLMRHGAATRVTSLLYLTPIVAVILEWALFGVVPTALAVVGIAVTCAGVALVTWKRRTDVAEIET
jgi:drug/metabolite transporter (DMT)-like permease